MNKRDQIEKLIDQYVEQFGQKSKAGLAEFIATGLDKPQPDPLTPTEKDIGKLCEFSNDGESWHPGRLVAVHKYTFSDSEKIIWNNARLYPHLPMHPWDSGEAPADWKGGMVIYESGNISGLRRSTSYANWPQVRRYTTADELAAAGIDGWGGES